MRDVILGFFGPSDSGKTTLVQSLLEKDLKKYKKEQSKGITIKVGYGAYKIKNAERAVLDAPGHACLSPESFRNLELLDCCMYLIDCINLSKPHMIKEIQDHYLTHYHLFKHYNIPHIILLNKAQYFEKEDLIFWYQKFNKLGDPLKIIPITANSRVAVSKFLVPHIESCLELIDPKILKTNAQLKVIKSFNINQQNAYVKELKGGILGCYYLNSENLKTPLYYWDHILKKWCILSVKKIVYANSKICTIETLEDPYFIKNDGFKNLELYKETSHLYDNKKTYTIKIEKALCSLKKSERVLLFLRGRMVSISIKKQKKNELNFSVLEDLGPKDSYHENNKVTIFRPYKDSNKITPIIFGVGIF